LFESIKSPVVKTHGGAFSCGWAKATRIGLKQSPRPFHQACTRNPVSRNADLIRFMSMIRNNETVEHFAQYIVHQDN